MTRMTAIVALIGFGVGMAGAQDAAPKEAPKPRTAAQISRMERADAMQNAPVHTFYLKHASQPNDGNEILTGLRLMLDPAVKLYLVPSENAIVIRALPDDTALAATLIAELDRERSAYKVTYVLNEFDGARKVSSTRYTLTMIDGQRSTMRQGLRVPVQTGRFDVGTNQVESQSSYTDVGLNFDVTVSGVEGGAVMKSKVDQSALTDDKPSSGTNPVMRQTSIDGVYKVLLGKPLVLGSLELPGSARRIEVEAVLEKVN